MTHNVNMNVTDSKYNIFTSYQLIFSIIVGLQLYIKTSGSIIITSFI